MAFSFLSGPPLSQTFKCNAILVLCEGNLCRSPMAGALLQAALGPAFQVETAGLGAPDGLPAPPEAAGLMAARGLDLSRHRSRQVTVAMANAADLILVMDRRQKAWCEALAPSAKGRVFLLGHWRQPEPFDIADPYRKGPEAFAAACEAIQEAIAGWLPHLLAKRRTA